MAAAVPDGEEFFVSEVVYPHFLWVCVFILLATQHAGAFSLLTAEEKLALLEASVGAIAGQQLQDPSAYARHLRCIVLAAEHSEALCLCASRSAVGAQWFDNLCGCSEAPYLLLEDNWHSPDNSECVMRLCSAFFKYPTLHTEFSAHWALSFGMHCVFRGVLQCGLHSSGGHAARCIRHAHIMCMHMSATEAGSMALVHLLATNASAADNMDKAISAFLPYTFVAKTTNMEQLLKQPIPSDDGVILARARVLRDVLLRCSLPLSPGEVWSEHDGSTLPEQVADATDATQALRVRLQSSIFRIVQAAFVPALRMLVNTFEAFQDEPEPHEWAHDLEDQGGELECAAVAAQIVHSCLRVGEHLQREYSAGRTGLQLAMPLSNTLASVSARGGLAPRVLDYMCSACARGAWAFDANIEEALVADTDAGATLGTTGMNGQVAATTRALTGACVGILNQLGKTGGPGALSAILDGSRAALGLVCDVAPSGSAICLSALSALGGLGVVQEGGAAQAISTCLRPLLHIFGCDLCRVRADGAAPASAQDTLTVRTVRRATGELLQVTLQDAVEQQGMYRPQWSKVVQLIRSYLLHFAAVAPDRTLAPAASHDDDGDRADGKRGKEVRRDTMSGSNNTISKGSDGNAPAKSAAEPPLKEQGVKGGQHDDDESLEGCFDVSHGSELPKAAVAFNVFDVGLALSLLKTLVGLVQVHGGAEGGVEAEGEGCAATGPGGSDLATLPEMAQAIRGVMRLAAPAALAAAAAAQAEAAAGEQSEGETLAASCRAFAQSFTSAHPELTLTAAELAAMCSDLGSAVSDDNAPSGYNADAAARALRALADHGCGIMSVPGPWCN